MENYGNLDLFGEPDSSFEKLGVSELAKRKSEAAAWLEKTGRKNLSGFGRATNLNRLVMLGNQRYILYIKNGIVEHTPYDKYMDKLASNFRIPQALLKDIKSKEGFPGLPGLAFNPGTANNFKAWYKNFIKDQKGEQAFFRKLGQAFQKADLEEATSVGKSKWDLDISHTYPKSKGGRFTFLEAWFANQARGARDFIPKEVLQEAGLPIDYRELFNMWMLQQSGMSSELGHLNDIKSEDIIALSKMKKTGETLDTIAERRRAINDILEQADVDPSNIPVLSDRYRELQFAARGGVPDIDGINDDSMFIDLAEDLGYQQDNTGKYRRVNPSKIKRARDTTGIKYLDDVDQTIDKGGWGFGKKVAGGLTIGGAASAILPEVGFSAVNRKTGKELGILASGEGDMSNVKGAVQGIGEDLVGGAKFGVATKGAQFGWKKALQLAGKRGAKHFVGKGALGKLVPYAGTALLAYSVYDTADAFVEGLTKKGISERIGEQYNNIIEDAFSPENSFFKQRKVKPENDIQGTL
jgi:hypothetical protein